MRFQKVFNERFQWKMKEVADGRSCVPRIMEHGDHESGCRVWPWHSRKQKTSPHSGAGHRIHEIESETGIPSSSVLFTAFPHANSPWRPMLQVR